MGVSTNYSAWFSGGTASTAVLTPAQVAAVAPLVRVTAAYVVMYYAFCFFQSWSKLYLSVWRCPVLFFAPAFRPLARRSSRLFDEAPPPPTSGVRAPRLAWRGGLRLRTSTRGALWRASRRWRAEFGIARSGLLLHHRASAGLGVFESPPIRHRRERPHTPSPRRRRRDTPSTRHKDTVKTHRTAGGA